MASYLVERLVQGGLASRNEDAQNRRRTLVQLTPQGEELLGHLISVGHTHTIIERLSALSEEELTACIRGLSILSQALASEPALLSIISHLPEQLNPSKSKGAHSEE